VQSAPTYFPSGTVSNLEQVWFGSALAAMKEPVLSGGGQRVGYFALRILYLPTWGPPVAMRYEGGATQGTYRAVMLSGQGGYDPGTIKAQKSKVLSSSEIANIQHALTNSGYWELPDKDGVLGFDGTEVVIETIQDGHHRVFVRWTPSSDASARKLKGIVHLLMSQLRATGFPDMGLTSRSTGRSPAARVRAGYLGR
jgi:hypothetical protein